ncbi:MAG: hypothetical protein SCARUB_04120 [Candidatus Scalindua rubra]|uniref:Cyclic nucleotide-binding domain-containing protein n=1 Tax=Candidatus Scalindua rubra TaxID=1872076 RepID=A0A1E3X562_9BACT|nr:MAG: hypothetical protein SCARUB_04120 [Candidatus Scalindua rubra]
MNPKDLIFTGNKLHLKKGEVIFKEYEEGAKEMYFIDSGRVKIVKKSWRYRSNASNPQLK